MIRNASGVRMSPSTKIIPPIEYTLNVAEESPKTFITRMLMTPVDGLRRRGQATAISSGDMMLGTMVMSSRSRRQVALVRITTQAILAASTVDMNADPAGERNDVRVGARVC